MTSVTYRVDEENNAEDWWDTFRAAQENLTDREILRICAALERYGEATVTDPSVAARFEAFAASLPGWETGPRHVRTALVRQA